MRPVKTHSFSGHVYALKSQAGLRAPVLARCWHDKRIIKAPLAGDTRDDLDCVIHESLHACYPYLHEDAVDRAATSVARLLWRLGWRKENE
jgi:hypothetical protein